MATIFDVGLLSRFSAIFGFLFVFVLLYGILSFSHFLGGNKSLQVFLAFIISVIVLITPKMGQVFLITVPWLTFLCILLAFIFLAFKMFGVTDSDLHSVVMHDKAIFWTVLSVVVIIMLWGIVQVYGTHYIPATPGQGETAAQVNQPSTGFTGTLGIVFFNPKVLGAVFLLLVAVFTIGILSSESGPAPGGGHGGH